MGLAARIRPAYWVVVVVVLALLPQAGGGRLEVSGRYDGYDATSPFRLKVQGDGVTLPSQGFRPIHMPGNTGAGILLAGIATVCGFALIWHIWWLAIASFVGLIGGAIFHTFNDKRDYHIPAEEVAATEAERIRLAAQGA